MEKNGRAGGIPLGKVVACQHLRDSHFAAQRDDIGKAHFAEPVTVPMDLGPRQVDDLADLMEVILRVRFDFIGGQLFTARMIAPAGVSHQSRVVANDNDGLMPEFLELPQLSQRHRVTEMDINARRINAVLDAQRLPGLTALRQLCGQFLLGHDLLDTTPNESQLFVNGQKTHGQSSLKWEISSGSTRVNCGVRSEALDFVRRGSPDPVETAGHFFVLHRSFRDRPTLACRVERLAATPTTCAPINAVRQHVATPPSAATGRAS